LVRKKYTARFLRCSNCGFIFIENRIWVAEAYAEPINRSDTGYVARNLYMRDKMRECIEFNLNPDGIFLDYAAGYGLFVRLMRDAGYDFRWSDLYCQNLFSRGFEAPEPLTGPYEAVTAFEVFEHLTNPTGEMKKLSAITSCLIFSTKLVSEPAPKLDDWWYYGLEHGQHIAFYTRKSLELLAARFGYRVATDGTDLHVFSKKQVSPDFFSQPQPNISQWGFWAKPKPRARRASLTMPDHDFIVKTIQQEKR
jgi:Methyltransferase domain